MKQIQVLLFIGIILSGMFINSASAQYLPLYKKVPNFIEAPNKEDTATTGGILRISKVSVPGYHLHFLTDDHQHGGHLLDCEASEITIEIQAIDQLSLDLPHSYEYLTADLSQDTKEELNRAEH